MIMVAPATNDPTSEPPGRALAGRAADQPKWLWADGLAGITLAGYAVPVALVPHTTRFSDIERNPDNERTAGVFAFRVEASLLYFNVDHVLREVLKRIDAQQDVRLVVCDLSTSPYVDLAGARMLTRLSTELAARGIALRLAETRATVRDILRAEGLDAVAGPISRRTSVADAIEVFQRTDTTREGA